MTVCAFATGLWHFLIEKSFSHRKGVTLMQLAGPCVCKWTDLDWLLLSPGFYELSDGGSCSRSNSCTSVYSESLSSSQTSLIPLSPTSCHVSPPPQVDVFHRRSVDESPGQPNPPRTTGLHLGSSRIRVSAIGTDYQTRPRPVSTGNNIFILFQTASAVVMACFCSAAQHIFCCLIT